MSVMVHAVGRQEVPALEMPERFRHEITYFMSLPGDPGVPHSLAVGEYWICQEQARRWLDDGVVEIVSPLDSEHKTEIELSEDHELWLEWLVAHRVEHLRLA